MNQNRTIDEKPNYADLAIWREEGKERINALLWQLLPGNTTLYQAESIACKIYEMIEERWRVAQIEETPR